MRDGSETYAHRIRIGTRGSALALAQVDAVSRYLGERDPSIVTETVVVATQGDIDKVSPLTEIGGRGVFTNALERELAHGRIDAAVHSAKDLPSQISSDLPIAAFPEREDPRDVLVSRHQLTLAELPPCPVIGTSSRRREAQIRQLRPDAQIVSLRGNIDTRLRKALQTEYDGIILAAAGLQRMGWTDRITERFPVDVLVPAPGQGALAIQVVGQSPCHDVIARLDDSIVSQEVLAEREFLSAIGAGCTMPVGAHVRHCEDGLEILAFLESEDGSRVARRRTVLDPRDAAGHASEIAQEMQDAVGDFERSQWPGSPSSCRSLEGVTVAVTRPRRQAQQLMQLLIDRGAVPVALPTIRIEPPADPEPLNSAVRALAVGAFTWVVFTSVNAVDAVAHAATELGAHDECLRAIRAATIGEATTKAALDLGIDVAVVAEQPTAEGLIASLLPRLRLGERLLYPRSAIAREILPETLREAGFDVTVVDAYNTIPESTIAPEALSRLRAGEVDMLTFSSPSSVRALQALLGAESHLIDDIPAICAGPVTAAAVREAGLLVAVESTDPGPPAMVDAVADYWNSRASSSNRTRRDSLNTQINERIAGR